VDALWLVVAEELVVAVELDAVEAGAELTVVVTVVELPHPPSAAARASRGRIRMRAPRNLMAVCSASMVGILPQNDHMRSRVQFDPQLAVRAGGSLRDALEKHDPFWGPQLVVAVAIVIDLLLPEKLTLGPTWLLPALEALALGGLLLASPHPRMRHSPLRRQLAMALIALVSIANLVSLYLLVHFLLHHGTAPEKGRPLIMAGIELWITNVLLFGLWYWELDRGGPLARAMQPGTLPDFLFPQMADPRYAPDAWMPSLIDYLYVSFTNATAFSPTDTMPLTQAAKVLMAAQSLGSLLTIGLVVARAVNILT
jgi:uncharacterized membrane protein